MRLSTLPLAALVALSATAPLAAQHKHEHHRSGPHFRINQDHDGPARPGPRYTPSQAQLYMNTRDDVASLFLTRDVIALQLTERTLRRVSDEVDNERDNDGFFARMIVNVVHNTVNNVLRRSLQIPLDELRSADYRDGRLILIDEDGDEVFENVEIEDRQVMEGFTPRDAQNFVRQFRALKAARR